MHFILLEPLQQMLDLIKPANMLFLGVEVVDLLMEVAVVPVDIIQILLLLTHLRPQQFM